MKRKKTLVIPLICALTLQCLAGVGSPKRAQAADPLTYNGWKYNTGGEILGYTGSETDITLPASLPKAEGSSVMIPMYTVGQNAIKNNTSITSVVIPEGYTRIEASSFENCTSLESVKFPSTICDMAVLDDSSQMQDNQNNCAFKGCTALREVTLPEGITCLGPQAFSGCNALEEIELPSTVTDWDYGLYGAAGLKRVTLPDNLTEIPRSAFDGCSSLEHLDIPDTVTKIDWYAFRGSGLTSLALPKAIQEINGRLLSQNGDGTYKDKLSVLEIHSLTYNSMFIEAKELGLYEKIKIPHYSLSEKYFTSAGYTNLEYLPEPEDEDLKAVPYEGEYDAQEHEAVRVEGLQEGDVVTYSSEKYGTFTEEIPVIRDAGNQSIWVRVERAPYYSPWQVNVTATVTDSRADLRKELEKELSKAERLAADKGLYTEESWGALEEAVSQARMALGNEDTLAGELKDALERLTAARTGLAAIGGPGTTDDPGSSSEPGSSNAPGTTGEPGTSSAPGTTDDPGTSSTPGTTDGPGTSSAPGTTETPGSSSQPGTTENPAPTPGQQVTPTAPPETPAALKKPVLKKVASGKKKKLTVKWKKVAGASGYQIAYSYRKDMKKAKKVAIGKGSVTSRTIAGLKSRKACYVRIRAWAKVDGRKAYSAWSSIKKGKVR